MKECPKNIEIFPAKEEHMNNIKSIMKDFYLDEPVFKVQKIDVGKLDKCFYEPKEGDFTIVARDMNNGAIVSFAINSIVKPDNATKQKKFAG